MKKLFEIIFFFLFFLSIGYSKEVPLNQAKRVAINWMMENSHGNEKDISIMEIITGFKDSEICYYIFNMNPSGFIIVSAEDKVIPVIGYSMEGSYLSNDVAPSLQEIINNYKNEILYAKTNNRETSSAYIYSWKRLSAEIALFKKSTNTQGVKPLITTKWHMNWPYNKLCPTIKEGDTVRPRYNYHVPVGCVAVAAAQVMKYYNSPQNGIGVHTYTSSYGTHSVDFGSTVYDWENMPAFIDSTSNEKQITAVSTLLYHVGVSINMDYTATGSGASPVSVQMYLPYFFDYQVTLKTKSRYSSDEWNNLIISELDNSRPVVYGGDDGNGGEGHEFVLDGYENNNYFHVNWGFGGNNDGYFYLSNLSPGGDNFSYNSDALFIKPGARSNASIISKGYTSQSTAFNWIDISKTGTAINNWKNGNRTTHTKLDDGYTKESIPIGFNFDFYSAKYNSIYVGINGVMSFTQKILNSAALLNVTEQDAAFGIFYVLRFPNNDIFLNSIGIAVADWDLDSLDGYGSGKIIYQTQGDKFILSYEDIGTYFIKGDKNSFQIILDGSNNSILMQYKKFGLSTTGKYIVVGIQGADSVGITWIANGLPPDNIIRNQSAILFMPPNNPASLDRDKNQLSNKYQLSQNYPNPFNPSTKIRFEISKSSIVSLKIYNTLGEEVSTLINKSLAPGIYEKDWNAKGLPSGVYLYKLQAGEYSETKRMVLMK
jgi:hypothetical protein